MPDIPADIRTMRTIAAWRAAETAKARGEL